MLRFCRTTCNRRSHTGHLESNLAARARVFLFSASCSSFTTTTTHRTPHHPTTTTTLPSLPSPIVFVPRVSNSQDTSSQASDDAPLITGHETQRVGCPAAEPGSVRPTSPAQTGAGASSGRESHLDAEPGASATTVPEGLPDRLLASSPSSPPRTTAAMDTKIDALPNNTSDPVDVGSPERATAEGMPDPRSSSAMPAASPSGVGSGEGNVTRAALTPPLTQDHAAPDAAARPSGTFDPMAVTSAPTAVADAAQSPTLPAPRMRPAAAVAKTEPVAPPGIMDFKPATANPATERWVRCKWCGDFAATALRVGATDWNCGCTTAPVARGAAEQWLRCPTCAEFEVVACADAPAWRCSACTGGSRRSYRTVGKVQVFGVAAEGSSLEAGAAAAASGAASNSLEQVFSDEACERCKRTDFETEMLLCDGCDKGYHIFCLVPKLEKIPRGDWRCPECLASKCTTEIIPYGFDDAHKTYSLRTFQEMADGFVKKHFKGKKPTLQETEAEFWRLVDNGIDLGEDVKVRDGCCAARPASADTPGSTARGRGPTL